MKAFECKHLNGLFNDKKVSSSVAHKFSQILDKTSVEKWFMVGMWTKLLVLLWSNDSEGLKRQHIIIITEVKIGLIRRKYDNFHVVSLLW